MFASVRTYRTDPAKVDELLPIIDEEFVPTISERPGLCAYQVVDCGDGAIMSRSAASARARAPSTRPRWRREFVRRAPVSDFEIERTDVTAGPLRISVADQGVLEPAHA